MTTCINCDREIGDVLYCSSCGMKQRATNVDITTRAEKGGVIEDSEVTVVGVRGNVRTTMVATGGGRIVNSKQTVVGDRKSVV